MQSLSDTEEEDVEIEKLARKVNEADSVKDDYIRQVPESRDEERSSEGKNTPHHRDYEETRHSIKGRCQESKSKSSSDDEKEDEDSNMNTRCTNDKKSKSRASPRSDKNEDQDMSTPHAVVTTPEDVTPRIPIAAAPRTATRRKMRNLRRSTRQVAVILREVARLVMRRISRKTRTRIILRRESPRPTAITNMTNEDMENDDKSPRRRSIRKNKKSCDDEDYHASEDDDDEDNNYNNACKSNIVHVVFPFTLLRFI